MTALWLSKLLFQWWIGLGSETQTHLSVDEISFEDYPNTVFIAKVCFCYRNAATEADANVQSGVRSIRNS